MRTRRPVRRKVKYTRFRPLILTRHPSHSPLRRKNNKDPRFLLPFRSVIRFGSTTETRRERVEINTPDAIRNSSSKLRMKRCFTEGKVRTAKWWTYGTGHFHENGIPNVSISHKDLFYPIVAKMHYGSRGNVKIDNASEMEAWLKSCDNPGAFIFEVFHNFSREYRLHVTKNGCFYTCRKMIKRETPDEERWYRNDKNSVWIMESNPDFDKPTNWSEIEEHCVRALTSVGLDVGAVDLRVQSSKQRDPDFIVIEINSAPSFGEVTLEKYKEILPDLLRQKHAEKRQVGV